jgi:hypothetical protein
MKPPAEKKGDADRQRQVLRVWLYLGLMVVGVFAAWLVGQCVRSYLISSRQRDRDAVILPRPTTRPYRPSTNPTDLSGSPLAAVGLVPLEGDPAGIGAPAGARRLYGFRRDLSDAVEQQVQYELTGTVADAAGHYTKTLASKGFALLKDTAAAPSQRVLVFGSGQAHATVALRKDPREEKIVIIVVTVEPPGASGPGSER